VEYFKGGVLNAELLDEGAEKVAQQLGGVSPSQLRRFYEDVLSLSRRLALEAEGSGNEARENAFARLRPEFKMLRAKAVYTCGRAESNKQGDYHALMQFFIDHTANVRSVQEFDAFCKHFQAVLAFHKFYGDSRRR
jgi:CRISPR-associated protein Csm2